MVGGYEGHIESLSEELEVTRSSYQEACGEVERLKEQLASLGSLQEQRDLLVAEVSGAPQIWTFTNQDIYILFLCFFKVVC